MLKNNIGIGIQNECYIHKNKLRNTAFLQFRQFGIIKFLHEIECPVYNFCYTLFLHAQANHGGIRGMDIPEDYFINKEEREEEEENGNEFDSDDDEDLAARAKEVFL